MENCVDEDSVGVTASCINHYYMENMKKSGATAATPNNNNNNNDQREKAIQLMSNKEI